MQNANVPCLVNKKPIATCGVIPTQLPEQINYIPPEPAVIKHYAYRLCAELSQQNSVYSQQEVMSGFASFLSFTAETMAKYLNNGHKEFLLKGYKKPIRK